MSTLDYGDDDEERRPDVKIHNQEEQYEDYEPKDGGKFLSEDRRMALFGKDQWINSKKQGKFNKPKGKIHYDNKRDHKDKYNDRQKFKPRKDSSASLHSHREPEKSLTPAGEEYDYVKL